MNTARDNISKAPEICFTYMPGRRGEVIAIKAGERGCYPVTTACTAEELNRALFPEPTPQQVAAALTGSMFGWEVPAANPDTYTETEGRELAYGRSTK